MTLAIPDFGLSGKVALVVGGGPGIARSSALYLAGAGASIATADIDGARSEQLAREINDGGGSAIALAGDATASSEADRFVAETVSRYERLNVVVNIIGMGSWAPAEDLSDEAWDHDLRMNLSYVFYTARAAARAMIGGGHKGSIVSIASIAGTASAPYHVGYGAAKAGLTGLTRSLAAEWGRHGIRVNAVAPGGVNTPRLREMGVGAAANPAAPALSPTPLGHNAETIHIAGAILFLASDLADHVTGEVITVDGGLSINVFGANREQFESMAERRLRI